MMIPPLDLAKLNQQLTDWCANIMEAEPTIADPERRAQLRQSLKQIEESQTWLNANYQKEVDAIAAREAAVQQQLAEGEARMQTLQAEAARLEAAAALPPAPSAPPPIDPQLGLTLRNELLDRYAPKATPTARTLAAVQGFSAEYDPVSAATAQAAPPAAAATELAPAVVAGLLQLAQVTAKDILYHLGCGDGRVLISAASRFQAKGLGVDADNALVNKASDNIRKARLQSHISVKAADPRREDCTRATVVVLSLGQAANEAVAATLRRQLKPGARIVSHEGSFKNWPADQKLTVDADGTTYHLHLWRIPQPDSGGSSIGGSGSVWDS